LTKLDLYALIYSNRLDVPVATGANREATGTLHRTGREVPMPVQASVPAPPEDAVQDYHRQLREAIGHAGGHAAGDGRTYRPHCPHCKMTPTVGARVSIQHRPGCPREQAAARLAQTQSRRAVQAPCEVPRQVPTGPRGLPEPEPEPVAAERPQRRRSLRRPRVRADAELRRAGIRARVVLGWFVSGARVLCSGHLATVRRVVCDVFGRVCVRVDFDEWDDQRPYPLSDLDLGLELAA
jgi:hypothetical protein